MPAMLVGRADPTDDAGEPVRHLVRRVVVAAAVSGLASYGLITLFGHGAHSAPRPQFAAETQQTGARSSVAGRPRLGVAVQMVGQAVTVASVVPGSAAAIAGLQVADVVTAVDGVPIRSPTELTTIVRNHRPGDQLQVSVVSRGRRVTITATLDSA